MNVLEIEIENIESFYDILFRNDIKYTLIFKNLDLREDDISLGYIKNNIHSIKFENCTGLEFVEFPQFLHELVFINCKISKLSGKSYISNICVDSIDLSNVDFKAFDNFKRFSGVVSVFIMNTKISTIEHFKDLPGIYDVSILQSTLIECEIPTNIENCSLSICY